MKWQWIGLVLFSLTLLPAGLAMAADRVPRRLRARLAPVRLRGWSALLIYSVAPLNTVPRLADASPNLNLACTAAGVILAIASSLLVCLAATESRRRRPRSTG
ncbi:hypothetical protein ND748_01865 [Frankia sp. AiPs1]|uniref:hypothetical protein n=1 Tax=Frankia sp. AiPs1 TaxID=573493 RepID=UPI002043C79E|nr:hypothetical protein [Frankia sp. AiPs1]MCM3920434.1 hypothetical protein [Frankia sp. AiPs1]